MRYSEYNRSIWSQCCDRIIPSCSLSKQTGSGAIAPANKIIKITYSVAFTLELWPFPFCEFSLLTRASALKLLAACDFEF